MQVLTGHQAARSLPPNGAVALGNFDGVHRGHQELCRRARSAADANEGPCLVFTFEPHPTRVLAPQLAPPLIIPLEQRLEYLGKAGVDAVILEPFTPELAKVGPDAFVKDILVGALRIKTAVVGFNFTFGHKRAGNPTLLAKLGSELGFAVDVVSEVTHEGLVCSSTKVRELVLEGNVAGAAMVLGRYFSVRGTVEHGKERGRTMGFPTANVGAKVELLPRLGVYAAHVVPLDGPGAGERWPAVVNVGVAPTFGGGPVTIEAHVLDRSLDLYGRKLEVRFVDRVRDEQRFPSLDALKAQIGQDVQTARAQLAKAP